MLVRHAYQRMSQRRWVVAGVREKHYFVQTIQAGVTNFALDHHLSPPPRPPCLLAPIACCGATAPAAARSLSPNPRGLVLSSRVSTTSRPSTESRRERGRERGRHVRCHVEEDKRGVEDEERGVEEGDELWRRRWKRKRRGGGRKIEASHLSI